MDKLSDEQGHVQVRDVWKPLPNDFVAYLPWACNQLQVDGVVIIEKCYQNEYVSVALTDRSKGKGTKSRMKPPSKEIFTSDEIEESQSVLNAAPSGVQVNRIKINAIFDNADNLVEIKFDKNNDIPRAILQIMTLILPFQPDLTALTINQGLSRVAIYELCNMIPVSLITDLCLDNTTVVGANYDALLEHQNSIRQLSLARCSIDDDVVKNIASRLFYPLPSSKTLTILNLSSNRITDDGAKHIAEVLRTNRQLGYLNLAGNMITDEGAMEIFDVLIEFPIECEELISSRSRHMLYLKEKTMMISQIMTELKAGDAEKKSSKKKPVNKPPTATLASGRKKGLEKESSLKSMVEGTRSLLALDSSHYDKAEALTENILGDYKDPFSSDNVFAKNETAFCYGNNALSYINLSYNNLTYFSVKKLLVVLTKQRQLGRTPRGLVNVSIEGNYMPNNCKELQQLDDFIEIGLFINCRRLSGVMKKRPGATRK